MSAVPRPPARIDPSAPEYIDLRLLAPEPVERPSPRDRWVENLALLVVFLTLGLGLVLVICPTVVTVVLPDPAPGPTVH